VDYLINTAGGAQDLRVVGGSHRIASGMASALPAGSLVLSAPVHRIHQDRDRVRISHAGGELMAKRAIVTMPPSLAGELEYEPAASEERSALTRAFPMGNVIKFQVLYDEPWWRDGDLSGQVVSFDDPIATTFDNSPDQGEAGVLLAFAEGDHARHLGRLGRTERRETVIRCLERFFGRRARDPRDYAELDWSREAFSRGCYGGRPGTGVLTGFGMHLRRPEGRIHWAGAETSTVSSGYMDGAIRSGVRAAAEVVAAGL
jgi:monoamine oxidase